MKNFIAALCALCLAFQLNAGTTNFVLADSEMAAMAPNGQIDDGILDHIFIQVADRSEYEHGQLWSMYHADQVEVEEREPNTYRVRVYEGGGVFEIMIIDDF